MSRKKPIKIKISDTVEVWENGVFEGKVVKSGNGAAIPFYKKFIGDEVVIILKDKMKDDDFFTNEEITAKMTKKWYKSTI